MSASPGDVDLGVLARNGRVHFMGIAGAGMSALAEWLQRSGGRVDGCDMNPGESAAHLRALGIGVATTHDAAHVRDAAAVVATAAVPADHAELAAARASGIPVIKRSVALGSVVNRGTLIAIAGTHGKTTTTAMTTAILAEARLDPTAFVGGTVAAWGGGLRHGGDHLFVVEADEYDRSFLALHPNVAVVTSVEADHLDVYGSFANITAAFREFLAAVPQDGLVAACTDDAGASSLLAGLSLRVVGYGTGADATLRAEDVQLDAAGSRFSVHDGDRPLGAISLGVPGLHNVRNALGALAAALHLGAGFAAAAQAFSTFRGVGRRFEVLAAGGDVVVVDDYAHHPTEISATLATARRSYPGRRLVAAFQPHLYTRTRDFASAFGSALAAADEIWLTDIYPAREVALPGINALLVVAAARAAGAGNVNYAPALDQLASALIDSLRPGDVLVAMGAGSIDGATRSVAQHLRQREAHA
jgi:UDP-N-acetylmuramate--alanine ligase